MLGECEVATWFSVYSSRPLITYVPALMVLVVLVGSIAAWPAEQLSGPESALMLWLGMLAFVLASRNWALLYTWMVGMMVAMALPILQIAVRLWL